MFKLVDVDDKYKILYLDKNVNNKFLTLVLMGIDNKYLETDLETLNNTSEHYKDKLNKRCQKKFKENFNENKKPHLNFLVKICEVNLTIKNITNNTFKFSVKKYDNTVYLVNKGKEYGLVLKTNKKSVKTSLSKALLGQMEGQMEKLSLEGGADQQIEYEQYGGNDIIVPAYSREATISQSAMPLVWALGKVINFYTKKFNINIKDLTNVPRFLNEKVEKLKNFINYYKWCCEKEQCVLSNDEQTNKLIRNIRKINRLPSKNQQELEEIEAQLKILEEDIDKVFNNNFSNCSLDEKKQRREIHTEIQEKLEIKRAKAGELKFDDYIIVNIDYCFANWKNKISNIKENQNIDIEQKKNIIIDLTTTSIIKICNNLVNILVDNIFKTRFNDQTPSLNEIFDSSDININLDIFFTNLLNLENEENDYKNLIDYIIKAQNAVHEPLEYYILKILKDKKEELVELFKLKNNNEEEDVMEENNKAEEMDDSEDDISQYWDPITNLVSLNFEMEMLNINSNINDSIKTYFDGLQAQADQVRQVRQQNELQTLREQAQRLKELERQLAETTTAVGHPMPPRGKLFRLKRAAAAKQHALGLRKSVKRTGSIINTTIGGASEDSLNDDVSDILSETSESSYYESSVDLDNSKLFNQSGGTRTDVDLTDCFATVPQPITLDSTFNVDTKISKINTIDYILELGGDSIHDFKTHRNLFANFYPLDIRAIAFWNLPAQQQPPYTQNDYISTLIQKVYDNFNTKLTDAFDKNSKAFTYDSGKSYFKNIFIKPQITRSRKITPKYNPFSASDSSDEKFGGFEQNSRMFYLRNELERGNLKEENFNVNLKTQLRGKKLIMIKDSQGDGHVIFSLLDNLLMRPGAMYTTFDEHWDKTLSKDNNLLQELQKDMDILNKIPPTNTQAENNDDTKKFVFSLCVNKAFKDLLSDGIFRTADKWFYINPATLVDPQTGGNNLDKAQFVSNLADFSNKLKNNINLKLHQIYPRQPGQPPNLNLSKSFNYTRSNTAADVIIQVPPRVELSTSKIYKDIAAYVAMATQEAVIEEAKIASTQAAAAAPAGGRPKLLYALSIIGLATRIFQKTSAVQHLPQAALAVALAAEVALATVGPPAALAPPPPPGPAAVGPALLAAGPHSLTAALPAPGTAAGAIPTALPVSAGATGQAAIEARKHGKEYTHYIAAGANTIQTAGLAALQAAAVPPAAIPTSLELNDLSLYSNLFRLMKQEDGTNKKNIMENIYKDHFKKISNNSYGDRLINDKNIDSLNIFKTNNIKFEMVLGEKKDANGVDSGKLTPVLLISFVDLTWPASVTASTAAAADAAAGTAANATAAAAAAATPPSSSISIYAIDFENLGEKDDIDDYIKKAQETHKFPHDQITLPKVDIQFNTTNFLVTSPDVQKKIAKINKFARYNKIYAILAKSQTGLRFCITRSNASNNNDRVLNQMFFRLLYTFKMIGDHGQVNFAKELKELDEENKYEFVFTTGDSLAALYASTKNITNLNANTISDFPSKFYGKSHPPNMVFHGQIQQLKTLTEWTKRLVNNIKDVARHARSFFPDL